MIVYVVPSVRTQRLHWLIRRMCYDDTLIFRNWHVVEYLYLERGLPQYRVFRGDELIGVARIRHPARLKFVQSALVDFLVQRGCNPRSAVLIEGLALTPLDAKVRDLPALPLVSKPIAAVDAPQWC